MKTYFPYQLNNILINLIFSSQDINDEIEIKLYSHLDEKLFSFKLKNGEIYDQDNIFFGNYLKDESNSIFINIKDEELSYSFNNLLIRNKVKIKNIGLNYIEVNKSVETNTFNLRYRLFNSIDKDVTKSILFISNDLAKDAYFINLIRKMNLTSTITVEYDLFNKENIDLNIVLFNIYDLIIISNSINQNDFDVNSFKNFRNPIIILSTEMAQYLYLITGQYIQFTNYEKSYGFNNNIDQKYLDLYNFTTRDLEKTNNYFNLFNIENGIYFKYDKINSNNGILHNNINGNNIILLDYIFAGDKAQLGSSIHSGDRIIVNVPKNYNNIWSNNYKNFYKLISSLFNNVVLKDFI